MNPMEMMGKFMQGGTNPQNIPFNAQQFKQFLPNINQDMINQLVQQARQQGISDKDIQAGLQYINSLR